MGRDHYTAGGNIKAEEDAYLIALKPVEPSELIDAVEFDSDEHVIKRDLQNGAS